MGTNVFEDYLNDISAQVGKQKKRSIELLKNYIRIYGEIDWGKDGDWLTSTFYCNGYVTADVRRVFVKDGILTVETDDFFADENTGEFTNDTILDILNSAICVDAVSDTNVKL